MAQRFLSNIKVNDAYTLPASDGTNGQAITTDGSGTLSFTTLGDGEVVKINCKNTSGATIAKGTPVYITGNVGNSDRLEIAAADASDSAKMPAVGLLETELANNAEGDIIVNGYIKGLVTDTIDGTSGSSNDTVYVKSGGGLTLTKPTGTNLIQNIAKVARVHASSGSLVVTSIMRTNDVPNIAENYIWLGNSSGVATATEHLLNNVKDVTTSSPTDGQVLTWDNANSYWKNADAASGGSSGTVTVEVNYSGDGTTQATDGTRVAFTVSSSIANEANTQVFINGVYQAKDKYSVSGTTLTFESGNAPPSGTTLEIVHLKTVDADIVLNSHTANGTDTAFDAGGSIANENNTQVYIDGVYQNKGSYTVSGGNVDFGTGNAPANGTIVEIVHIKPRPESTGGISWQSTAKTAAFTAVAGEGYFVDTSSSEITVTLPSSPSVGNTVSLVDYASNASTNNITITSSNDIMNSADDKVINYDNGAVELVYSGSTKGWLVSSAANETDTALAESTITVDYLVVGGGGAGGGSWRGGAGGAGAVRTSYATQGGSTAEADALSLSLGTNYTVTVGGGGSGSSEADGANGSDSVFSTITANGGGGGAGGYNTNDAPSYTGNGSGGGGNGYNNLADSTGSSGGTYGNDGGDGGPSAGQCGGGGGGAGAAGIDGGTAGTAGDGGNGVIVNILNSTNATTASVGDVQSTNVYYGGGGAGGSYDNGNNAIPGLGGGGDGGYGTTSTNADEPDAGSPNTGGGGGGCAEEASFGTGAGGNGGSGVVILRYPSTKSITVGSGLTQASGSPFTEGSDKVSVFTGGSGNISFS